MSSPNGIPFKAILHSADASSGVAVPIYKSGESSAFTPASDDFLEITDVDLVTVAGGDSYIVCGADATLGNGETVARGTFAANGGISKQFLTAFGGIKGGTLWAVAPAGVVDVVITGRIRK